MASLLDDLSLMEDRDLIAELAGGKAVSDINRGVSHNVVITAQLLRHGDAVHGSHLNIQKKNMEIPLLSIAKELLINNF